MRWGIRSQLLAPLVLLFVGVVGISVWIGLVTAAQTRHSVETRVRDVARMLSEGPPFPLVPSVLELMKRLSGADFVLVGEHGLVTTLAAEPAKLPPADAVIDDWQTLQLGPRLEVAGQAFLGGGVRLHPPRQREVIYILYPETLWRAALWKALWPVGLLGGLVALAAVGLAFGPGQRLSTRIAELERRTRLIAAGDFSPMPLPSRDDEVRNLGRSINEMAQQLAQFQETARRTERLRLLGQVSGGLAHQLRNGVAGARLAVQVFLQEQPPDTDVAALEVTLRELTLLETKLKRFLDLGRPDEPRRERCAFAGLVEDALSLLRPGCRHSGIELTWKPPEEDSSILGDPGQLGQMIVNVVSNAIEAAGPGGAVELRLRNSDGTAHTGASHMCVLEVWDTGPGPSAEVAQRLFEPFVTAKPEGVGLGLAVARQVAETHGGRISWRRAEHRTGFQIELPAADDLAVQRSPG